MRELTVFHDDAWLPVHWLGVLTVCRKELLQRGLRVNIADPLFPIEDAAKYAAWVKRKLLSRSYDIVAIASHRGQGFMGFSSEEQIDILKKMRDRCRTIVFMDINDSTGTCEYHLLPYVDRYLKRQLLADRELYTKPQWGGRIYTQYYHDNFGIDSKVLSFAPAPKEELHKMGLSWNIGLLDTFFPGEKRGKPTGPKYLDPGSGRDYLTYLRCSVSEVPSYFQRSLMIEKLEALREQGTDPDITFMDLSIRSDYRTNLKDLQNARTALLPFGFGEICTRDFDAIFGGCTMIKPDMDHLVSYPDWFIKDETYLPLRWDLEDLPKVLRYAASEEGRARCLQIAENAQAKMKEETSARAKEKFAEHLLRELNLN